MIAVDVLIARAAMVAVDAVVARAAMIAVDALIGWVSGPRRRAEPPIPTGFPRSPHGLA